MFEPLRFLHVAEAMLDVPLGDLPSLPEELQTLAEDATLLAFDSLVAGAIAREVDFVLLTGTTFREEDHSLRARLHLRTGLKKLADNDISVFVLPGPDDSEAAWQDIANLPANVSVLSKDDPSEISLAVLREGRVIATIAGQRLTKNDSIMETESLSEREDNDPPLSGSDETRLMPFRIGLLTLWPSERCLFDGDENEMSRRLSSLACDYLAVLRCDSEAKRRGWRFEPGQTINTNDGIAHHPGPLQALTERETGPHGATLIDVDEAGEIRGTFLPFAAVRRLQFEIPVSSHADWEDVAEAMLSLLDAEPPLPNEQGWFITWTLTGSGAAFESLKTRSTQTEILDFLPNELSVEQTLLLHHQLKFQDSTWPSEDQGNFSELERLYRETLLNSLASDRHLFPNLADRVLAGLNDLGRLDWLDRLAPLAHALNADDVLAKAHALGSEWFAEGSED